MRVSRPESRADELQDGLAKRSNRAEGHGGKEGTGENMDEAQSSVFDLPMACAEADEA